jgi:uncharacterized DUF497 family protein
LYTALNGTTPKAAQPWKGAALTSTMLHAFSEGTVLEREDRRRDYGEPRIVCVGQIEGEVFVVVYTWRGNRRCIISAGRASRRERDAYRQAFSRGDS